MKNEQLLAHLEKVHDEYLDLVDKVPTEDKIMAAYEGPSAGLEPWEISEITQSVMSKLPESLRTDDVDILFDLIYDAITEGIVRTVEAG